MKKKFKIQAKIGDKEFVLDNLSEKECNLYLKLIYEYKYSLLGLKKPRSRMNKKERDVYVKASKQIPLKINIYGKSNPWC